MIKLICIAMSALVLALPASAGAGVHLRKAEARSVIVDVLREDDFVAAYPDADWYDSFWVAPARSCKRIWARAVECAFSIFSADYDDPDRGERVYDYCDGIMRIRERPTRYVWSERAGECGTAPAQA